MWMLVQLLLVISVSVVCSEEDIGICKCDNRDIPQQNMVCEADYVIKVKVNAVKILKLKWLYEVTVLAWYKPELPFYEGEALEIFTKKPNKDPCGITLYEGNTYILSAKLSPRKEPLLDQCDSLVELVVDEETNPNVDPADIHPKQLHLENLMTNFRKNCDCKVTWVSENDIFDENITDLDLSRNKTVDNCIECMEQRQCTNRVSYCKREGLECKWNPVSFDLQKEGSTCKPMAELSLADCNKFICSCKAKAFLRF